MIESVQPAESYKRREAAISKSRFIHVGRTPREVVFQDKENYQNDVFYDARCQSSDSRRLSGAGRVRGWSQAWYEWRNVMHYSLKVTP